MCAARDLGCTIMTILITRSEVESSRAIIELGAMGYAVLAVPLVEIIERETTSLNFEKVAAIIVTSRNGVRALSRAVSCRDLPLFAVGTGTAAEAAIAGHSNITIGPGDVRGLTDALTQRLRPSDGPLIYASGLHVASDLSGDLLALGYDIKRVVLYEAREEKKLPKAINKELRKHHIASVVFFSSRIASIFVTLVERAGLSGSLADVEAVCMSEKVAATISPQDWKRVLIAENKTQESLLDVFRLRNRISMEQSYIKT